MNTFNSFIELENFISNSEEDLLTDVSKEVLQDILDYLQEESEEIVEVMTVEEILAEWKAEYGVISDEEYQAILDGWRVELGIK